jgi:polyphenol oxidase
MGHNFGSYGEIGWVTPPQGWLRGAQAAVSLRPGGSSPPPYESLNLGRSAGDDLTRVTENERRWALALRLPGPAAMARLEHATRCVPVDAPGIYKPCDGLVTDRPNLPLWLTVADCFPLFVSVGNWIGLMHCGWKGTAQSAPRKLVDALATASALPRAEQRAWIGPGIGPCCYPVGPEVAGCFPDETVRRDGGEARLDLRSAIRIDLVAAGLAESQIEICDLCTSCRPDIFFSYRRDGIQSGRMAAVIWR